VPLGVAGAPAAPATCSDVGTALRIIEDHLRHGLTHFNLCAHFVDLRRLLFELGSENLYFFLLLSDP